MEQFNKEIYFPSIWNCDKKIPPDYDTKIIPEIEKITKYILGDIIKNVIYNNIIHYYNLGKTKGILETVFIGNGEDTKRVYFKISKDKIKLKLINNNILEKLK